MKYCSCTLGMIGFSKEASSFFPGLFQHFLRTVPFLQEFPSKFLNGKRVKNPPYLFFPLSQSYLQDTISEVPPAARKYLMTRSANERESTLSQKLLQGLSPPLLLPFREAANTSPESQSLCTRKTGSLVAFILQYCGNQGRPFTESHFGSERVLCRLPWLR